MIQELNYMQLGAPNKAKLLIEEASQIIEQEQQNRRFVNNNNCLHQ